jgi:hypothetical protein
MDELAVLKGNLQSRSAGPTESGPWSAIGVTSGGSSRAQCGLLNQFAMDAKDTQVKSS